MANNNIQVPQGNGLTQTSYRIDIGLLSFFRKAVKKANKKGHLDSRVTLQDCINYGIKSAFSSICQGFLKLSEDEIKEMLNG